MAKLVKAADLFKLSRDTSTLTEKATGFILPYVSYDQQILDNAYEVYGDNSSLAIALSGTSDKKSHQYKAALRSIQIWKKTDKGPGKPAKGRVNYRQRLINAVADKNGLPDESIVNAAGRVPGVVTVSITGYVQISQTPAEYRTLHANMSGETLQEFLELAVTGDNQSALDVFATAGIYPAFDLYGNRDNPIVVQFS